MVWLKACNQITITTNNLSGVFWSACSMYDLYLDNLFICIILFHFNFFHVTSICQLSALLISVFSCKFYSSAEVLDCPYSLSWPVVRSADVTYHILFEKHSVDVVWTVCLCFSEGTCSEYAVLAFPGPFKLIKQEIKVLLMPQLCYQDAVTDLTANKNDLLRQTVSNHPSGLDFIGNMGILLFSSHVSQKYAHDFCDKCIV